MRIRFAVLAGCLALTSSCASGGSVEATRWTVLESEPSSDTLVIAVVVGSSSCGSVESVEVAEDDTSVTIRTRARTKGGNCNADCSTVEREVQLKRPLGERTLRGGHVDGVC